MASRLLRFALVATLASAAWAQTQSPSSGTGQPAESLADRSPSANVRSAAVQQRAPGNIIRQAIARHRGLINDRVTAARTGQSSADNNGTAGNTTSSTTTPTSTTGGAGGSNILGNLLSGGLLGGGNLTNLIGSLTNNTPSATPSNSGGNGTGSTGGATNNPNIPPNITPEVISLLQSFGININDVFPPPDSANRQQARPADSTGLRAQQQTPPAGGNNNTANQPKFLTRLVDSLLSTIFNALVLGVQTQAFIDSIKNQLRPLFGLTNPASSSNSGSNAGAMRWPSGRCGPHPCPQPLPRCPLA